MQEESATTLKSFAEIINKYDVFVFDIWGVVHDGYKRLPGVLETLQLLKAQNKRVFFLSNMPNSRKEVAQHLAYFGIDSDLYEDIYSSGQTAIDYSHQLICDGYKKAFRLGRITTLQKLIAQEGIEFVSFLELADFILLTYDDRDPAAKEFQDIMVQALTQKLFILCTNPDRVYVEGAAFVPAAGSIAAVYEAMGGQVKYIGKPYPLIYQTLVEQSQIKGNILAIGDTLEVDILGAQNMGWDTLLVLTGVSALQYEGNPNNINPKYIINNL